jgi:hypothetical protein
MTTTYVDNNQLKKIPVKTTVNADGSVTQHVNIESPSISTVTESTGSVTTSSTTLLAANTARTGGYIQNTSDTDIYISLGGTATTSKTLVSASGGVFTLLISGRVYTGAITAIHTGTGSKSIVLVQTI